MSDIAAETPSMSLQESASSAKEPTLEERLRVAYILLAALTINAGGRLRIPPNQMARVGTFEMKPDPVTGGLLLLATKRSKKHYEKRLL